MRKLVAIGALAAAWLIFSAHVGSPNVFFEGEAGNYPVRVVIRPPDAIPGLADISVRVGSADVQTVTVRPVRWDLGLEGAPRPDEATKSPGEPDLWTAQLWFMDFGSYSVYVGVDGPDGAGEAIVPVPARATSIAEMPVPLQLTLAGLGIFLFVGLLSIVGAAAREADLQPGEDADARQRRRARLAQLIAAPLIGVAMLGGARWWEAEDAGYANNLYVPMEIEATAAAADGSLSIRITDERWTDGRYTPLMPDHGKLMHLFLIGADGAPGFAHLHPASTGDSGFRTPLPELPAGEYLVFADVLHESGYAETLTDTLSIPSGERSGELDADDSWLSARTAVPAGGRADVGSGFSIAWEGEAAPRAGQELTLSFSVSGPDGNPAELVPYMGMASHAAIVRNDGSVFVHLHPMGTISVASQQMFRDGGGSGPMDHGRTMPRLDSSTVAFPWEFPRPGAYRVWVQVRNPTAGVLTAEFDVDVTD